MKCILSHFLPTVGSTSVAKIYASPHLVVRLASLCRRLSLFLQVAGMHSRVVVGSPACICSDTSFLMTFLFVGVALLMFLTSTVLLQVYNGDLCEKLDVSVGFIYPLLPILESNDEADRQAIMSVIVFFYSSL
jgi:hypothetical protein